MEWTDVTIHGLREKRPDLVEQMVQEGATSRDSEVKSLIDEKKELAAKVDEFEVKESIRHKNEVIDKVLKESKLPNEAITDVFRESLYGVNGDTDEDVKKNAQAMIDDRKAVIESVKNGGVVNNTEKGDNDDNDDKKGKNVSAKEATKILRS